MAMNGKFIYENSDNMPSNIQFSLVRDEYKGSFL